MKIVNRKDVPAEYRDIVAIFPNAVLVEDELGRIGFEAHPFILWLLETEQLDLNRLCIDFEEGRITADAYLALNRDIGFDLYHFAAHFENGTEKRVEALENAIRKAKAN